MRELVTKFVSDNLTTLQTDFDQLEPKDGAARAAFAVS